MSGDKNAAMEEKESIIGEDFKRESVLAEEIVVVDEAGKPTMQNEGPFIFRLRHSKRTPVERQ